MFHSYILDVMAIRILWPWDFFGRCPDWDLSGPLRHWYNGIEYCIDDLCIASEHQGQGFGSLWIQLIRNYACQHGFRNISLQTKRNAPAYHFYQKPALKSRRTGSAFLWTAFPDLRAVPRRAHRAVDFCSEGRSAIKFFLWNV